MYEVLTIDADYWFPMWQGGHCGHCKGLDLVRRRRAGDEYSEDEERTNPTIKELVALVPVNTPVHVTESHANLYEVLFAVSQVTGNKIRVVNLDEHNDGCPFRVEEGITCANWVSAAMGEGLLHRYKHLGSPRAFYRFVDTKLGYTPDLVHVCRSKPYMSTKGDQHFVDLVVALERKTKRPVIFSGHEKNKIRSLVNQLEKPIAH